MSESPLQEHKHQQPRLDQLGAYPFERLSKLLKHLTIAENLTPIDAGAGEPRLPLPPFVSVALQENIGGFSNYPMTSGNPDLCGAIAAWLQKRYHLTAIDARSQVLSANGTREALFAVAHALVNPEAHHKPYVIMPNPMYQIYYGAALLAGAEPYFLNGEAHNYFEPDLELVPNKIWENTAFIYVCSPSNPTGWIASQAYYQQLLQLADQYDFYIVADECYSEIYQTEPPIGLLEVCEMSGRNDFSRCLVMNSLSKRSALPGLRSGLIAGDAQLIQRFRKLRSYTGPATPLPLQHIAAAAWRDESHVQAHLATYQASMRRFSEHFPITIPEGSFFLWLHVGDGEAFAQAAYEQQAITLLPGAYLSVTDATGYNPGAAYVRIALLDGPEKSAELASRLQKVTLN
ncbi:MAG: aminotransferase class I/II-fold pyridoxal phosphate-dependent enzyme [Zetaproteobacteria bacterium]|nr:aminotransferase class I/II-fold pyridoxal phosphate-dependent enzyme [Zetaproteobacteria bacterium]